MLCTSCNYEGDFECKDLVEKIAECPICHQQYRDGKPMEESKNKADFRNRNFENRSDTEEIAINPS